ncbi:type I polyketide synthase [Lentzea roselyniae]|uniref:Type I polyketide synthase n=1 Tax=Lentzea roselyniae TaxID=531940 RepID=A0ABP7C8Y7_9PSEU
MRDGRDLISDEPPERFRAGRFLDRPGRPGKTYSVSAGFLDDVAQFDAGFFGISPREAGRMDPQQRLALELTVEALDDAGLDPGVLAGTDTCVYAGVSSLDYGVLQQSAPKEINSHTLLGTTLGNVALRVSYVFDLRGPSMAVDTACSSALVALHQACQALRTGESRTALAFGVNVLLNPLSFVAFSQARMLSKRGRCQTFAGNADGYVRAEGGGLVVLKRLSDAVADGDRIHAVLLGTATNSDGRTAGMALPSRLAQRELLCQVYRRAGVDPDELVYLEAHGTGTPVGDPIECRAIGEALALRRTAGPLPIGSVKTNLGHLEPASGIVGLLKAMLVLRHRTIPPSLYADSPSPEIDFAGLRLAPAVRAFSFPETGRAVIGVNSFGFGGANAHAIVAAPPAALPSEASVATRLPLVVSARSEAALRVAVDRYAERLDSATHEEFYDLCWTAVRRRGLHDRRVAVLAASPGDAARRLRLVADGAAATGAVSANAVRAGRIAFVFCGNGSQWAGMGADLLTGDAAFRAVVKQVDDLLRPQLGWSVVEELRAGADRSRLADTFVAQPALFAVQVGVVESLRERGIEPEAVVGHSVGEVAAAYACGALSLDQAVQVIAERAAAQAPTAGAGRMAAVGLPPEEAEAVLASYGGRLGLAAVNTDRDVTVSGDADALERLGQELTARKVFFRELDVNYPFHSPAMDVVEAPLRARLAGLRGGMNHAPFVSTVTGAPVPGPELDADYWWRNVREPVRFADAVRRLLAVGVDTFVEIGPHPVLGGYLRRLRSGDVPIAVVPTLTRDTGGEEALDTTVASLIAAGARIDWNRYFPSAGRVVDLPAYPWQRERHWHGDLERWYGGPIEHPLLGERDDVPEPSWRGTVEPVSLPWLGDHVVDGAVVMPAAGYAEIALAAGRRAVNAPVEIDALNIMAPLVLPWTDQTMDVRLHTSVSEEDGLIRIAARTGDSGPWRLHARGRVRRMLAPPPAPVDLSLSGGRLDGDAFYAAAAGRGMAYGPAFRVLRELWIGDNEVVARYAFSTAESGHDVHPVVLDGALQAAAPLVAAATGGQACLPVAVDRVRVWREPAASGLIRVRGGAVTSRDVTVDIIVCTESGETTVELRGCRLRRMPAATSVRVERHVGVMRAAPRLAEPVPACPMPTPQEIAAASRNAVAAVSEAWRSVIRYDEWKPRWLDFTARVVVDTMRNLLPHRDSVSVDDLVDVGVLPRYRRLLENGAATAQELGLLRLKDGRWRPTCEGDALARFTDMVRDFPERVPTLTIMGRCARNMSAILCGELDPVDLIFPEYAPDTLEGVYDTQPEIRLSNLVARELCRTAAERWSHDRPLRILEVGAGTGGLTACVLPVLPRDRARYLFTDRSTAGFPRAAARFADYDFLEHQPFDLNQDPEAQGLPEAGFDIVIASLALHTAGDLSATLDNIGRLLGDDGLLLAVEAYDTRMIAPLFGLLDDFWAFTDTALRPSSPLLNRTGWTDLLTARGYADVVDAEAGTEDFGVMLARRPARAEPVRLPVPARRGGDHWIVLAEPGSDSAQGHRLADVLGANVAEAIPDEWDLPAGTRSFGIAVLFDEVSGLTETDLTTRRAMMLRSVAAACARVPEDVKVTMWVVTRPSGAQPGPESPASPVDAAVWGMTRTLANEQPRLVVRRISLERGEDPVSDVLRLATELLDPATDDEIVLTRSGRFVPRMVDLERTTCVNPAAYSLRLRDQGPSYRLDWTEADVPVPAPDEVVIAVRAAALNYRDVMWSTGLLPAEAMAGTVAGPLGLECAGVVTAMGSNVTGFAAGDRVFALAPSAFGSHAVTKAASTGRMPDGMSFSAAASLPVAFVTVHYGLGHLARLGAGDVVLVHGAAGGVGLAAVQHARLAGAEVIATAGTPEKRDLLRLLGVRHVLDSRSLRWADEVAAITDGRGVDVVLNSLSGEAISRGLELLRPGGRFVELGKRDLYENRRLLLRALCNDISLFAVNLDVMATSTPRLARLVFSDVVRRVWAGDYRPLPHRTYPATRVGEAFRLLQHSRHIGKVIVTFDEPVPVEQRVRPFTLDADATYLVAGGLGGFGAATARWLAQRGARHLTLVGRRGAASPEASRLLAELTDSGVTVAVHAADIADLTAMRAVFDAIDTGTRPLRGVIHSAMVLDDAPLAELTEQRFRTGLAPKMAGGRVLDVLTLGHPLDFFVVYSSGHAHTGHLNQTSYTAGNLFLEALVRQRRAAGHPGTAMIWGAIGEVGQLARDTEVARVLEGLGIHPLPPSDAFANLEDVLVDGVDVAMVWRHDRSRPRKLIPGFDAPRFDTLAHVGTDTEDAQYEDLRTTLTAMGQDEAAGAVTTVMIDLIAGVLQTKRNRLDPARRLDQLGMDSLMAVELATAISRRLDVRLAAPDMIGVATISDLTALVLKRLSANLEVAG